jgi:3-oxoacyl-[acyl-carrier-protein] synthase II
VALECACADASLDRDSIPPHRVGMVLGCALAGQLGMMEFATEVREQSPRFVSPIHFPQTVGNYPAGALARAYGIRGPNATIACGVASGLDAIAEARGLIASGQADVAFAGGTDTLSEALANGLAATGLPTSDGACFFVMESAGHASARGAKPLAAIIRCAPRGSSDDLKRTEGNAVRSGTCGKEAGTIVIDHWMGHCPGSLGAACVAAAIGAARGHAVPIRDPKSQNGVEVSRVQVERLRVENGTVRGVVFADTDDTRGTTVELTIPLNR